MVSIVITVFNEENTIERLIKALKAQSYKKYELIIVDGGSSDKTIQVIRKYKDVKFFLKTGNRSVGRNYGVQMAKGEIIAFTDAGCIPESNWLEELTTPFKNKDVDVVSGYYKGLPKNIFQKCLIPYVLVMPDRVDSDFLPATRSMAIRKSVFIKHGGFDARLEHNEDYVFANKLKQNNVSMYFARTAVVGWIPRTNLKQTAWMFLRFAIGDAQAGILRPKVKFLAIRYYLFFFLVFINAWFALLAFPYVLWAVFKNFKYVKDIRAVYWLPILQVTADIMVLFGTIVGLLSRIK